MLIALFILVTALTATIVLMVTSINASRESRNKLIATNLSREGLEAVRNLRDSNWLDPAVVSWDDGLTNVLDNLDNTAIPIINSTKALSLDFSVDNIVTDSDARVFLGGNDYLQGNGLSGSALATQFYRIIYLNPICRRETDGDEKIVAKAVRASCDSFDENYTQVGLRVISEVHWPSPNKRNVILEERLYDWQVL